MILTVGVSAEEDASVLSDVDDSDEDELSSVLDSSEEVLEDSDSLDVLAELSEELVSELSELPELQDVTARSIHITSNTDKTFFMSLLLLIGYVLYHLFSEKHCGNRFWLLIKHIGINIRL